MFNDYAKKLEELGDNVPKTFKRVAQKGANHFEKTAKQNTDYYGLVDTGVYRRNWWAEATTVNDAQVIKVGNDVEYASHLEYGHKLRNGKQWKGFFVGRMSLDNTEAWTIQELRAEIEAIMLSKKTGVSRDEAMKIINS